MTDLKNAIVISLFPTKESARLNLEEEFTILKKSEGIGFHDVQEAITLWVAKLKKKYPNVKTICLLPYGDSIFSSEVFMVFSRVMLENNISWKTLKISQINALKPSNIN